MSRNRPFTRNQCVRLASQYGYGHRPVNDWGDGDLPAPWAEGDLVLLPPGAEVEDDRLSKDSAGYWVVCAAFSIDHGDAWYFRVTDGAEVSDRLHVGFASRSDYPDLDYMAPFQLVDTADPHGLTLRNLLLEQGWTRPVVER